MKFFLISFAIANTNNNFYHLFLTSVISNLLNIGLQKGCLDAMLQFVELLYDTNGGNQAKIFMILIMMLAKV